jgi:hypothetical protein
MIPNQSCGGIPKEASDPMSSRRVAMPLAMEQWLQRLSSNQPTLTPRFTSWVPT